MGDEEEELLGIWGITKSGVKTLIYATDPMGCYNLHTCRLTQELGYQEWILKGHYSAQ